MMNRRELHSKKVFLVVFFFITMEAIDRFDDVEDLAWSQTLQLQIKSEDGRAILSVSVEWSNRSIFRLNLLFPYSQRMVWQLLHTTIGSLTSSLSYPESTCSFIRRLMFDVILRMTLLFPKQSKHTALRDSSWQRFVFGITSDWSVEKAADLITKWFCVVPTAVRFKFVYIFPIWILWLWCLDKAIIDARLCARVSRDKRRSMKISD